MVINISEASAKRKFFPPLLSMLTDKLGLNIEARFRFIADFDFKLIGDS